MRMRNKKTPAENTDPMWNSSSPFGGSNPLGGASGSSSPFGGSNPLSGASGSSSPFGGSNPLGGASGSSSPFGGSNPLGNANGSSNPFGGSNPLSGMSGSGGMDPFGSYEEYTVPDKEGMITALICGAIGMFIGLLIYTGTELSTVLKIGLLTLLTAGLPLVGLFAYAKSRPERQRTDEKGAIALGAALLLLFGCGCLMQFLYNLTAEVRETPIDDYVFVIDDSGSMETTDPYGARITSLNTMIEDMAEDKRIGLVCFTDVVTREIPLNYATRQQKDDFAQAAGYLQNDGGTDIQKAVVHALEMDGVEDKARVCMLVLLTDGGSQYYVSSKKIAAMCTEQNAIISTIGLSDQVDANFLRQIAGMTGGTFYGVDELDQLATIYTQVSRVDSNRDLLGVRPGNAHNSVGLGAMRVFSWVLFAAIEALAALMIVSKTPRRILLFAGCLVCGACLGGGLELLSALWLDGLLTRAVLLLLPGVLVLFCRERIRHNPGAGMGFGQGSSFAAEEDDGRMSDFRKKKETDAGRSELR